MFVKNFAAFIFTLLIAATQANASLMYLRIEGDVDFSVYGPEEFVGENMVLTWEFDFSRDGLFRNLGESIYTVATDTDTQDYFYASLIESSIGGVHFIPDGDLGDGYDARYGGRGINGNKFFLLRAGDLTSVYTRDINFDEAYVGYVALESDWAHHRDGRESGPSASIQNRAWEVTYLSSINPLNTVPTPTTFTIFCLGLAGLGWSRRLKA